MLAINPAVKSYQPGTPLMTEGSPKHLTNSPLPPYFLYIALKQLILWPQEGPDRPLASAPYDTAFIAPDNTVPVNILILFRPGKTLSCMLWKKKRSFAL
jgi:hypothetical protein